MSTKEAPVNAGHAYANAAEEYEDRENWTQAIEAHQHAAEQFQKAIDDTQDPEARKTLQLLTANHTRKIKDIQRRIQFKRQMERTSPPPPVHAVGNTGYKMTNAYSDMNGLRNALPDGKLFASSKQQLMASLSVMGGSYAVLSTDDQDDSDPFEKFWEVILRMLGGKSNPVAFTSAPIDDDDIPTPLSKAEDDGSNCDANGDDDLLHQHMLDSYYVIPVDDNDGSDTRPSGKNKSQLDTQKPANANTSSHECRTLEEYAAENGRLKAKIDQLTRRIQRLEKTEAESNMLKSSFIQFRNDVQKQAQRIMQTQDANLRSSSAISLAASTNARFPPSMMANNMIHSDLVFRIKELEEENRQLKARNEKQEGLMKKYRERWEKLKESAKKRRQPLSEEAATAATSSTSSSSDASGSKPPTLLRTLAQQQQPPTSSLQLSSTNHSHRSNVNMLGSGRKS
ncbi:uncharacterized protein BYT42DRAFT_641575 [Radiomyces spectabilis]|uniref:uncharacterized protein n=1 Tax=Radiomyces spectabilis TaxID=64574 RepID=UPI00221FD950|nr:uncharacterized protein BYT42DRAFT_641575 [Radiomyces spectabilis]KAI8391034.1 hypothetical protein BYT42DRAFT_641575 [Radiomyces spectabilis]